MKVSQSIYRPTKKCCGCLFASSVDKSFHGVTKLFKKALLLSMIYSIRELKKGSQRFLNTWQNMSLKNDAAQQFLFLYQHIKIFWFPPEKNCLAVQRCQWNQLRTSPIPKTAPFLSTRWVLLHWIKLLLAIEDSLIYSIFYISCG